MLLCKSYPLGERYGKERVELVKAESPKSKLDEGVRTRKRDDSNVQDSVCELVLIEWRRGEASWRPHHQVFEWRRLVKLIMGCWFVC